MKNSNPLVSVLMPVYNGEKYLFEAIQSILNQTYQNFEILIIDDCSTDNSVRIIQSINDKRVRFLQNKENLGQTKTLNKGIYIAKGKYIARQDQDDLSENLRLELQVNYLEKYPDIKLVGSSINFIDNRGNLITKRKAVIGHNKIINAFSIDNQIAHSSAMFCKSTATKLNGYSLEYKISQDFEFWLRFANENKLDNLDENLISIRMHEAQTLKNKKKNKNYYFEFMKVYQFLLDNHLLNKKSKKLSQLKILLYTYYYENKLFYFIKIILFLMKNFGMLNNRYFWIWIRNRIELKKSILINEKI